MASRVLMGSAALGGVFLVWSVVSQRSMVAKIDGLTDRIALLEERSGAVGIRRAGRVDGADSRAVFRGKSKGRRVRPAAAASEDTGSAPPVAGSAELTEIPDSLRDELVQIVEDEQEIASENRRVEWRTRMREGMRDSVEEFVDDRGISDDVAEQMRTIFEDGMEEMSRLYTDMRNEDISWYQFRKEMKANREAWEGDLEAILSEDDYQEILEVFPRRH